MKALTHERECARTASTTKKKAGRDCALIVRKLEHDPSALALVVRIAEALAGRSPIRRRFNSRLDRCQAD